MSVSGKLFVFANVLDDKRDRITLNLFMYAAQSHQILNPCLPEG